jgi:glutathione-regulated potassium-efflux system ancillary protein KefG
MRLLVLFAHPKPRQSVVQRAMLAAITGLPNVTIRDLYATYPDFMIDSRREQALLAEHDVVVFQHPMYWYSSPAIVKEWLDIVLQEGWAYGAGGTELAGKFLLNALSTGGPPEAYHSKGRNRFAVRKLDAATLSKKAENYRDLLVGLRDDRLDPLKHLAEGYQLPRTFRAGSARHAS